MSLDAEVEAAFMDQCKSATVVCTPDGPALLIDHIVFPIKMPGFLQEPYIEWIAEAIRRGGGSA